MNHLGERLSALIDGELSGSDLDRANAHLAACKDCRDEAFTLRLLKRELRALGEAPQDAEMVAKLMAMAGPGGPIPPRRPARGGHGAPWRRAALPGSRWPISSRPGSLRSRRRYAVAGVLGIAMIGISAAAFNAGGGNAVPAPRVTPPMEIYSVEHAITTGDVPIPEQSGTEVSTPQP
jgi:anti-sigma factor RsiW